MGFSRPPFYQRTELERNLNFTMEGWAFTLCDMNFPVYRRPTNVGTETGPCGERTKITSLGPPSQASGSLEVPAPHPGRPGCGGKTTSRNVYVSVCVRTALASPTQSTVLTRLTPRKMSSQCLSEREPPPVCRPTRTPSRPHD